jgi:hypothetical protein
MCSNSISVFTFKRNTAGMGKKELFTPPEPLAIVAL